jgi:hypothetical protein
VECDIKNKSLIINNTAISMGNIPSDAYFVVSVPKATVEISE